MFEEAYSKLNNEDLNFLLKVGELSSAPVDTSIDEKEEEIKEQKKLKEEKFFPED